MNYVLKFIPCENNSKRKLVTRNNEIQKWKSVYRPFHSRYK